MTQQTPKTCKQLARYSIFMHKWVLKVTLLINYYGDLTEIHVTVLTYKRYVARK